MFAFFIIANLDMTQQMASANSRSTSINMIAMKAVGTGSYPLTVDVRVDLLEVLLGVRGKFLLPLAPGNSGGTITSIRHDTISGSGAIITIRDLDRISIITIAEQLFPIGIKVTLVISTHVGHTKVMVDEVTLVLLVAGHRQSFGPSMASRWPATCSRQSREVKVRERETEHGAETAQSNMLLPPAKLEHQSGRQSTAKPRDP